MIRRTVPLNLLILGKSHTTSLVPQEMFPVRSMSSFMVTTFAARTCIIHARCQQKLSKLIASVQWDTKTQCVKLHHYCMSSRVSESQQMVLIVNSFVFLP